MDKICPFTKEECIPQDCALYVCVPGDYPAEGCAISLSAWKLAAIYELAAEIKKLVQEEK